ncbi:MAG: hypothetical protein SA378_10410 [Sedimentibacter sp.]|uniref:hypothetical protein n=1 Tax=Sedimentibacter sp. TaxID=1960295 RepID=UPI00298220C2|nr:hypothetical protein [Sedimentibacter sp.]MDW5300532.1 hypothetical protein [Sedimentibacter sp.]
MQKKHKMFLVLLIVICLYIPFTACSGDEKDSDKPEDAASAVQDKQEDETTSYTSEPENNENPHVNMDTADLIGESASLPESYPSDVFPLYEGSYILTAVETEGSYTIIALSKDDFKKVADFYREVLTKVEVTAESNFDSGFTSFGKIGSYTYNFDIGETSEYEEYETQITIMIMAGE